MDAPRQKLEKQEQAESRGRSMKQTLLLTTLFLVPLAGLHATETPASADKLNIVFILADDAGIGDFSCYGCKYGVTPNIDRLAKEGMLFTHAYSGNAVCCPSRCVLTTGLHPGHALFRANDSCQPTAASRNGVFSLPANQITSARILHAAGYATGGFGKWGLGNPGTTGAAEKQGFDGFFGHYDQVHAHIDGISFLPVLHGEPSPVHRREFYFVRREGGPAYGGKTINAFRRDDWKLLQYSPFKPLELYDLKSDPRETTDLAEKNRRHFNELSTALRKQIQRAGSVSWQAPQQSP
jgi:arylsulfatase A-like enzyme